MNPRKVEDDNNEFINAYGQGIINIEMCIKKQLDQNNLTNVVNVPEVGRNLFSI